VLDARDVESSGVELRSELNELPESGAVEQAGAAREEDFGEKLGEMHGIGEVARDSRGCSGGMAAVAATAGEWHT